ncbi:MAG: TOBE domain-containing protein, partial [Desulfobacula sp.]|nr:TOBE domain-containing protein [Desulfobacula sp.]
ADKIILMKDGVIEQHGTPEDLYNRPATAFTGSFIGNPPMNILNPDAGIKAVFSSQFPLKYSESTCLVGVRPENIEISDTTGLEAEVSAIEYLGADTLILCQTKTQPIMLSVKNRADVSMGHHIKLTWKPEHLHFFDADGGQRINSPAGGKS